MKKLAVIGKDVSQSVSPQIHKFIAAQLGLQIGYERLSIPPESFAEKVESLFDDYDGFNVTIPYKLSIMEHLKEIEGDATDFGAVNTVVTATRTGYNTDGRGFMQMIKAEGVEVNGRNALVLGAGGAGRSVAKKLADDGARVEIYSRTFAGAQEVASRFNGVTAIKSLEPKPYEIVVNATGVGMHGTVGVSPVDGDIIKNCSVAIDLIYVPEKSAFLEIAESFGKKIINGKAMLFYQAYYADCLYFGLSPDGELAAKLFEKFLKEKI